MNANSNPNNIIIHQYLSPKLGAIMSENAEDEALAKSCMQRIKHLKTLRDNELITQEDFETRKSQIVDQLTGTSSGTMSM